MCVPNGLGKACRVSGTFLAQQCIVHSGFQELLQGHQVLRTFCTARNDCNTAVAIDPRRASVRMGLRAFVNAYGS